MSNAAGAVSGAWLRSAASAVPAGEGHEGVEVAFVPLLTYVGETETDPAVRQQALTTLDIVRDRIARQDSAP